ncbi:uncharacterized protein PV09_04700 [Verruconis gallopava]|uniref:Cytochrome P450 n=1 Tax=Verruconis gallopava TaxID=253628 RepID=A0A0D2ADA8_9PEZI|nr:uncharacterized protein PV09_04700 [Verruconis gallopava]KIW04430.1 hypothetical protein PV09_04700 [Verruconis gallopava]
MGLSSLAKLVLATSAALGLHLMYLVYRRRKFFRNLPCPPHSWILGHLGIMGEMSSKLPPNCHPQLLLTEIQRTYDLPPVFYMDLWPAADPMVLLTEVEDMNYVQVLKPLQQHPSSNDFLAPMVGRDVVAVVNGPTWKMLRNAMNPSFAPGHVKNLSGIIIEECLTFRSTLSKLARAGRPFDMEVKGAELIFDIIARIVFNFPLAAQKRGSQTLSDLRELVHLVEAGFSMNPLDRLRAWWRRGAVTQRLNSEVKAKILERYQMLREQKVVPSRKDPYSTLDLMLREQLMREEELKDLDLEFDRLLLSNIKGLLLGGHGTTNDTLCYCYMLLSKNPAVMAKLREEHTRVFAADFDQTVQMLQADPYKLNELEYTTAVIKETLRLFPVGFGVRAAPPGATITSRGRPLPIDNGLAIVPLWHHMHYSEAYFADPASFSPERFMDADTVGRATFRSFSRGPRGCAGQELAIDELRIILLMTVRDFDFEYHHMKPNERPRVKYTQLDTVFGDVVFQELGLEAKPRGGMVLKVHELKGGTSMKK